MAAPFNVHSVNYFGPTAASISLPTSAGMDFNNPTASYNTAYRNATNINQQLHENVQSGYAQMLRDFQAAQGGLQAGYRGLETRVLRRLRGSNRANIQDLSDKYTALSGQMSQQMIDRGLGNTTVQQSVQRGVAQDRAKEVTRSQGLYAQMMANAQMGIGGNALSAMQAGIMGASGIQQGAINAMERVSAPYPDPGLYASLAAQLAQGRIPTGGLPGMPGPSRPNSPIGGAGPQGAAFYSGGGMEWMAGPSSGASLMTSYNPSPAPSYGGGYSGGYASIDPSWISASKDNAGFTGYGYGGSPQLEAMGYGAKPVFYDQAFGGEGYSGRGEF